MPKYLGEEDDDALGLVEGLISRVSANAYILSLPATVSQKTSPDWQTWRECKAFYNKHRRWPKSTDHPTKLYQLIRKLDAARKNEENNFRVDEQLLLEARRMGALQSLDKLCKGGYEKQKTGPLGRVEQALQEGKTPAKTDISMLRQRYRGGMLSELAYRMLLKHGIDVT
jgi:hypothetical protein